MTNMTATLLSAVLISIHATTLFFSTVAYGEEFQFPPESYPEFCHTAARHYSTLPKLELNPDYVSPREVVLRYSQIDTDKPTIQTNINNAVRALGGMSGYARELSKAYDNAANNYWHEVDREGNASVNAQKEYAYWIWRRFRFQGEASELQMLYLSTGAGAFKFLGDTVSSLFPVPRLVDDQKSAQIYDYVKLSECTPIHAQSLDSALEYEIFLDNYPKHLDRVSWVEDKIDLASFSDNEKRALLQAMRENRRLSVDDPPRSGIPYSREGALEVIDRIKTGVPAALADFIDTFSADRDRAIDTNSYRALLAQFGDAAYRRAQSDNFIYRMFSGQRRTSLPQNVTIESIQDWAEGGPAPAAFAAMSAEDAAMCAVERWEAAAHYVFERVPDAVERLKKHKSLALEGDEYCTDVGFRKTKIVCLGEDTFKIAYFSCLTNKPIGQPGSLVNRLTLRYRR